MKYRLGIDVGEENTVCVLMDHDLNIIHVITQGTTPDIVTGIDKAVDHILEQTRIAPGQISSIMVGTTRLYHFLREGKNLSKVGVVRIGYSKSHVPPLFDGPELLHDAIAPEYFHLTGGHEVNGSISIEEPKAEAARKIMRTARERGVEAFAITATFSPVNDNHERMVAKRIEEGLGSEFPITLSSELGSVGFIERENATILNAALSKVMAQIMKSLDLYLKQKGINANIFVSQNDGTLMSYEFAMRFPIRTLHSSITNSFRGVSFLTHLKDCVIVHVGPAISHVGLLEGGFPKERSKNQSISGVRVNVPMPEIFTFPFGGDHLTDDLLLEKIFHSIQRYQPRYGALPIVLIGEGSKKMLPYLKYPWAEILIPDHYQYVSAIGACIAPVSGTVDRMFWLHDLKQEDAVELAKRDAAFMAIQAGAIPESIHIQTVQAIPLSYITSKSLRVKVKVIGTLL